VRPARSCQELATRPFRFLPGGEGVGAGDRATKTSKQSRHWGVITLRHVPSSVGMQEEMKRVCGWGGKKKTCDEAHPQSVTTSEGQGIRKGKGSLKEKKGRKKGWSEVLFDERRFVEVQARSRQNSEESRKKKGWRGGCKVGRGKDYNVVAELGREGDDMVKNIRSQGRALVQCSEGKGENNVHNVRGWNTTYMSGRPDR